MVLPAGTRIYGVRLESTSDNCAAILFDAITQALGASNGNQFCTLLITEGTGEAHPESNSEKWTSGGITLERGLSVTLTGTTPKFYIYYA